MTAAIGATTIRRLRVNGTPEAGAAVRRVVAAAGLRPPGLPPAAVLLVRRLGDEGRRRPVGRLPGGAGLRHALRPPAEWESGVRDALAEAARRAARPALGPVPADVPAVLFADRAEVLAALAADWADGSLASRWWWPAYFGRRPADAAGAVVREWLAGAAYVPAAVSLLAAGGAAVPVLGRLGAAAAAAVVRAVGEAFGVGTLAAVALGKVESSTRTDDGAEALPWPADDVDRPAASIAGTPHGRAAQTGRPSTPPPPPWRPYIPAEPAGGLTSPAAALLWLGLMLHRAPAVARRPAFGRAVREYMASWGGGAAGTIGRAAGPTRPVPQVLGETPTGSSAIARPDGSPPPASADAAGDTLLLGRPPAGASGSSPPAAVRGPEWRPVAARPGPATVGPGAADQGVDTALGGLFFLLNLFLYLDLYGDFSTPDRPGLDLSPWDLIVLVGRRLLWPGDEASATSNAPEQDDPVWPLLADLAGRAPTDPPGHCFTAPDEWRVPTAWLEPFRSVAGPPTWDAAAGRLRVRHPAGFRLVDVPVAAGDAAEHLARETATYREYLDLPPVPAAEDDENRKADESGPGRCLDCLVGYVRARLAKAVGPAAARDLAGVVLRRPARGRLTAAHVDVWFALAEHPVELRLAGLDRDPGFVPAAGRVVAFHFE